MTDDRVTEGTDDGGRTTDGGSTDGRTTAGHAIEDRAARRALAADVSMVALMVSVAGSVGLAVAYAVDAGAAWQGLGLLAALGGIGVALIVWGRHVLDEGEREEPRHPLASSPEEREDVEASIERDEPVARRRALRWLLGGALVAFAGALLAPIRSLGPAPSASVGASPWRRGQRLVDGQDRPIHLDDVPTGGLVTAFPEHQTDSAQGQVALVRVDASSIRPPQGRESWSPDGLLAYSKVCTHAGCPVSLYLADSHELLCPCHQSAFDALRGARPVQGPAARALPQLPLTVDADGTIRAAGDLSAPVGPAWWNRP